MQSMIKFKTKVQNYILSLALKWWWTFFKKEEETQRMDTLFQER
jgi:hypothetical protein